MTSPLANEAKDRMAVSTAPLPFSFLGTVLLGCCGAGGPRSGWPKQKYWGRGGVKNKHKPLRVRHAQAPRNFQNPPPSNEHKINSPLNATPRPQNPAII